MREYEKIYSLITNKLDKLKEEYYAKLSLGNVEADKQCKVSSCTNKAISKGFCNAHYLRSRFSPNTPMERVVTQRHSEVKCTVCGEDVGGKGGWGL